VTPLLPALAGFVVLLTGIVVLRRIGSAWRVGRLIASTPRVSVAEAIAFGRSGRATYVAVAGRIDSSSEFEDADHRPLVFRRTRLEAATEGAWVALEDRTEAVPFELHEGLDAIRIDGDALTIGLVVVPRIAEGTVADLDPEKAAGLDPAAPVRFRVDQVSSVEHAIVLGVPVVDPIEEGEAAPVRITAGLGRPLILTTLEPPEAMRILASEAPVRPRLAGLLIAVGLALEAVALAWAIAGWLAGTLVLAATPSPGQGGDPRSSGEGPGLVGEPGLAIVAVIGLGIASLVAVQAWVKLTGRRDR
jgi:hypothetical protein